jgi:cellulose synthase/poly-beta-1,6-N-acetylglucosamine synthase-like glycosyltransferase
MSDPAIYYSTVARVTSENAQLPPCLSVIIPVYNEAGTVEEVIFTVLKQPLTAPATIV